MEKHKAIIVGAGRIGAGYKWALYPFLYTHAEAYMALKERVELTGFVDPDISRLIAAGKRFDGVEGYWTTVEEAIAKAKPDIVSICTPPELQEDLLLKCMNAGVKGVWCEKPFLSTRRYPIRVQVNYIRRFEPLHQSIAAAIEKGELKPLLLLVKAKRDIHTVSHFTNLSLMFGKVPIEYLRAVNGKYSLAEYELFCEDRIIRFVEGGSRIIQLLGAPGTVFTDMTFPREEPKTVQKWTPRFMENALSNLLDVVDGGGELLSPVDTAIESERLAKEILK